MPDHFDQLADDLNHGRAEAAFARLAETLAADKRYHELFDARLLEARQRHGLPLTGNTKLDEVPEPARGHVEEAYLSACREVGRLLLADGKIREAWMYLRPAEARAEMRTALETAPADEEAAEEFIAVALQEGVHPIRGFELVLKHFGTCNSITTFESQMQQFPPADQQAAAALLVRRLHDDLTSSVRAEIQRQESKPASDTTLAALVAPRDWLFLDRSYHVDTSHLAAVVRFARICDDAEVLRLALDLTEYGRRLDPQYHFEGDEPFTALYSSHALWFQALLDENVEQALAHFRDRAENVNIEQEGSQAAETYVWLLARLGRYAEALAASQKLLPPAVRRIGIAPPLMELARLAGDFGPVLQSTREQGDLVGYASAVLAAGKGKARGGQGEI